MTKPIVFIGPSLSLSAAQGLLDAHYLPPIGRGDLPRAVATGSGCAAIIDGLFGQSLAVSISEIRDALAAGVQVWGASSMGALRAAECHVLGMRGVGWVYEAYRSEELTSDDEVAISFDPVSGKAMSEPLVNLRWAMQLAESERQISAREQKQILSSMRDVPFNERSLRFLLTICPPEMRPSIQRLQRYVAQNSAACDRKALDAVELLRQIASKDADNV